jgi:hypothetical protein
MKHPTARSYETEEQAREAYGKLMAEGFPAESAFLLTPSAEGAANAIRAGQDLGYRAGFFADRLAAGRSVVIVFPPFGHAVQAAEILDSCNPVDTNLRMPSEPGTYGPGAPLSEWLCLPPLSKNNPAPLSASTGMPVLSHRKPRARVGNGLSVMARMFPPLTSSRFYPAGLLPLLFKAAAVLPIPTLIRGRGGMKSKIGMPLVINDPAPLSRAFGLPLLTKSR